MRISENGIAFIKRWEGLRLKPYKDVAGHWTIGYGHLIRPHEDFSAGITEAEAEELLRRDLAPVEADVNLLVRVPLTQNQFDALVSFAFNVGTDVDADEIAEGLGDSTLLKKLNAGDYVGAAEEFVRVENGRTVGWVHAGGKVVEGLVNRREAEKALFLTQQRVVPKPQPEVTMSTDTNLPAETESKPFWQSKTVWANVVGLLALILQGAVVDAWFLPPEWQGALLVIINFILRLITKKKIVWTP